MPRRAVVVVHGVGSQKKGETLTTIVEPLVRYLRRYLNPQDPHALQVTAAVRPDRGPAAAELWFRHNGQEEHWVITEAWWAQSFDSDATDPVVAWGWRILRDQAASVLYGILGRHLPGQDDSEYPPGPYPYHDEADRQQSRRGRVRKLASRIYDFLLGIALLACFLAAYIAALTLATAFYLVAQLPSWLLIVGPAASIRNLLVGTLIDGPGDQYAMTQDNLARASATRPVLEALAPHLDNRRPDFTPCETVTLIAHSGGCVVTYNALSDAEVKKWAFGAAAATPARVTWFTVGSGLNLAFRESRGDPFWRRGLDARVTWIDLWARHDPVPHGQADHTMERLIRTPSGHSTPAPFINQRVVNRDNPFSDHGEYWRNYEEVVSRFVYAIMNGPGATTPLGIAVRTSIGEVPTHRALVARNFVLARLVGAAVVGGGLGTGVGAALGRAILSGLSQIQLPSPFDAVMAWLGRHPTVGPVSGDALAGTVGLGVLVYLGYRLYTLILRGMLERGDDWGSR
jgi:hypothetical protein